jgi:hypothetical protein
MGVEKCEDNSYLAKRLLDGDVVLFVGSGISIWPPSKIPTGLVLKRNLFERLCDHDLLRWVYQAAFERQEFFGRLGSAMFYVAPIDEPSPMSLKRMGQAVGEIVDHFPLEILLEKVNLYAHRSAWRRIANVFYKKEANNIHRTIAALLANNLKRQLPASYILTTNFDILLEEALRERRQKYFSCFLSEHYTDPQAKLGKVVEIFKLHGSVKAQESLVMTMIQEETSDDRVRALKPILEGRDLCFIGYSASDIDISRFLRGIDIKSIYWVVRDRSGYERLLRNDLVRSLLQERPCYVSFDLVEVFNLLADQLDVPKQTDRTLGAYEGNLEDLKFTTPEKFLVIAAYLLEAGPSEAILQICMNGLKACLAKR